MALDLRGTEAGVVRAYEDGTLRCTEAGVPHSPAITQEDGYGILLETGDRLLEE